MNSKLFKIGKLLNIDYRAAKWEELLDLEAFSVLYFNVMLTVTQQESPGYGELHTGFTVAPPTSQLYKDDTVMFLTLRCALQYTYI